MTHKYKNRIIAAWKQAKQRKPKMKIDISKKVADLNSDVIHQYAHQFSMEIQNVAAGT